MCKAVSGASLTEREKRLLAYNLFEGKTIARLLSDALTEKEGITKTDYFLKSNMGLSDEKEIESIRQMIVQVIVSYDNKAELAKRYIDYTGKIR